MKIKNAKIKMIGNMDSTADRNGKPCSRLSVTICWKEDEGTPQQEQNYTLLTAFGEMAETFQQNFKVGDSVDVDIRFSTRASNSGWVSNLTGLKSITKASAL